MITASIQGLEGFQQRYGDAAEKVFDKIDVEIGIGTENMELNAKRNAPKDQGTLAREITHFREDRLEWAFVSQASYSAFVEFGTRSSVVIPPGLEGFASEFQGSGGSSLSAKQAIFNWCRRKGIDQKLWYAIFVKIMTKGVNPHPFFFPAFEEAKPEMLQRIQAIL